MFVKSTPKLLRLIFLSLFLTLCSCYTVPETGRKSMNLMSDSFLDSNAASAFAELKKTTPISKNKEYNDQVTRIGKRIAQVVYKNANLPPPDAWEFVVFEDDKTINAFAMPGGKVGVYTGMFKVAKNDNQLATVMGHEIAHVAAKHGNERVSQQLLLAGGGIALGIATRNSTAQTRLAILAGYGLGSTLGVLLPFSRKHESEADYIGLIYSSRAGYDPREAVTFWQNMENASKGKVPEFLSTHPSYKTRIQDIQNMLPKAIEEYNKATKTIK